MSKEGSKITKTAPKKKVNKYTKQECLNELERMRTPVSDTHKGGVQVQSNYYKAVQALLQTFA